MHVVIIGNGIAGSTAARFLRKWSVAKITMISDEYPYPFSRTALMYIFMGHLQAKNTHLYENKFWSKNRIDLLQKRVDHINFETKSITFAGGGEISYDTLVLATGSKVNKYGWPGENLEGVQGLYHWQDLEKLEAACASGIKRAVIVGGGLIGIELAEMLHSRGIEITYLVREKSFSNIVLPAEESEMVNQQILRHGIDLRLETELKEICDDEGGKVKSVITSKGKEVPCDMVALTAGVSPNVEFLRGSALLIRRGIVVDSRLQTNIQDVFAIGDCAEVNEPADGRKSIEAVWYTGRKMGQVAAANILGKNLNYNPGVWFNSAKFFNLEYQVYGQVFPEKREGITEFIWQDPHKKIAVRICFDSQTEEVLGFNLMGMRFRHEVCENWIQNKQKIDHVMENLLAANFDPEFYKTFENQILEAFNQTFSKKLSLKSKRNLSYLHKIFAK